MQNILHKNRNLITFLAILILVIAIPITVFVSQQQQDIRQRAQEATTEASLHFTRMGSKEILTSISFTPNAQHSVDLYLDTKTSGAHLFNITIRLSNDITNISVVEGADGKKFENNHPDNTVNQENKLIQFGKFKTTEDITGKFHLLTLSFTTGATDGKIEVVTAKVNSLTKDATGNPSLTVKKPTLSYTISAAAAGSPTPTPAQIAIVSSPTPTPITSPPAPTRDPNCPFDNCSNCVKESKCGWDGANCQRSENASCPAGKTIWNWNNCSKNECAVPTPTLTPPITSAATFGLSQCDIKTDEGQFTCRANCIFGEIQVNTTTTCINKPRESICCLDHTKGLPTPTPTPSSECRPTDCSITCQTNAVCAQVKGDSNKNCICQSISSLTPTVLTPSPACPLKSKGDADCNGEINIVDFNVWRDEFTGKLKTTTADFNGDGSLDIKDFSAWRDGFIAANVKKK